MLKSFRRQALHAETLTIRHPESGEQMSWTAAVPSDYAELLKVVGEHTDG